MVLDEPKDNDDKYEVDGLTYLIDKELSGKSGDVKVDFFTHNLAPRKIARLDAIGSLLVAEEYIIPQDLDFALEHQKHSKTLIGEILVRIGAVEPQALERVLTIQKKMTVR